MEKLHVNDITSTDIYYYAMVSPCVAPEEILNDAAGGRHWYTIHKTPRDARNLYYLWRKNNMQCWFLYMFANQDSSCKDPQYL